MDCAAPTAPGVNATEAVCVTATTSVTSAAEYVDVPDVVDVTENVTTPDALEGPDAAEIVSVAPRLEERVTVLPATGVELASLSVTVTMDIVEPSATTAAGEDAMREVDPLASRGGGGASDPNPEHADESTSAAAHTTRVLRLFGTAVPDPGGKRSGGRTLRSGCGAFVSTNRERAHE